MLALASAYNWPLSQLDVECAFLHGNLYEAVVMAQQQGHIDPPNLLMFAAWLDQFVAYAKHLEHGMRDCHQSYWTLVFFYQSYM